MRRLNLLSLAFISLFVSCQNEWYEEIPSKKPRPLTYMEEVAIINNYTTIDTVNNCYSVAITDEIMQNERLTEDNVKLALQEISKLNNAIRENIKDGTITTLTLNNSEGFKSYTPNIKQSDIKFMDVLGTKDATTRGGNVGKMSFNNGNWYDYDATFEASDHVTSKLYVNASSYWQVNITCDTGTSSYGNKYSVSGSGNYSGNRYWWWTGGGSAPFRWKFRTSAPIGGNASGSFSISNTY